MLEAGQELPNELFAWVTEVGGRKSLVGASLGAFGSPVALVFASEKTARNEGVERMARAHGQQLGQPVQLVKFTVAEVIA